MSNQLTANIKFDNGFQARVDSADGLPLTEAKIYKILAESQKTALAELTTGNPYPEKIVQTEVKDPTTGGFMRTYKKVPTTDKSKAEYLGEFYKSKLSKILQTPKSMFDFENGLSTEVPRAEPIPRWARSVDPVNPYTSAINQEMGMRTNLSDRGQYGMLQTTEAKIGFLVKKFGKENVAVYKSNGVPLLLWREEEKGDWKFPEGLEKIEMADFTSDISGEILPTLASVAVGVPSLATAPLASAVTSAGAYSLTGAMQDYLVNNTLLDETDVSEIVNRRAKQFAIQAPIEYVTMKTAGRLIPSFLGREGTDLFESQMKEFVKIADGKGTLPKAPYLREGVEIAEVAKRIESKMPNGAVAKVMNEYRRIAGETFEGVINPNITPKQMSEDGFREGIEHINNSLQSNRDKLLARLTQLEREAELANNLVEKQLAKEAKEEAVKLFDAQVAKFQSDVLPSETISPALGGDIAQTRLGEAFVQANIRKSQNFNDAYSLLENLDVPVGDFNNVLARHSNDLISDINEEAVGVINANSRLGASNVVKRLDELAEAGGSLDFKTINEIIQKVEEKTRRGNLVAGFDANAYRALADDLRGLRSKMLESPLADPQGVAQYELANQFYRDDFLPFIDVEGLYKAKIGQNYSEAINLASQGMGGGLPPFSMKSDRVLGLIVKDSGSIDEFLRLSGGDMDMVKLLRNFWLQSKGLQAGRPINPQKVINMSEADMDSIRVLWREGQEKGTPSGVAGWNDRVAVFKDLQKIIGEQDEFVADISAQTFERLMNAGTKEQVDAVAKIARQEILINQRLAKHSQVMVKLAGEGKIPLPSNRVQMKTFLNGLKRANPKEQEKFIKLLRESDSSLIMDLRGALFHDMVRLSRAKSPIGTQATSAIDNPLWDAQAMVGQLETNSELLSQLIGRESFDKLVASNNALVNLMKPIKGVTDTAKPRVAVTPKGLNVWVGNATAPVTDRFGALLMNAQSNSPIPVQLMLKPETYDTARTTILRSIFLGVNGYSLLNSEAESSPEFNAFLSENMGSITKEIELRTEQIRSQEKNVQPPAPNTVGRSNFQ